MPAQRRASKGHEPKQSRCATKRPHRAQGLCRIPRSTWQQPPLLPQWKLLASLHRVQPVTRGARVASFFWIQSMVRSDGDRTLLFDLDVAIQRVSQELPNHPSAVQLTNVYHNLLRRWAEM